MINTTLLCHPCIGIGEGPNGYLLRLAEANQVNIRELHAIGIAVSIEPLTALLGHAIEATDGLCAYIERLQDVRQRWPGIWNSSSCRYCPECVAQGEHWHVGWEILFFDACPIHKCWLVDQCDECGNHLTWGRARLHQCDCGYKFKNSRSREAPETVVELAQTIHRSLLAFTASTEPAPLTGLSVEQLVRLVRFMGAYGQLVAERLPQKIRNVGSMSVSWQFTSIAAEILFKWPQNFERLLSTLLEQSADSLGQRFVTRFGFYYSLLYRRFGDPEFHLLRAAFENFVAQHWHGPIAKRHKRLSESLLESASWVSANHARRQLQVSDSRLSALVRTGVVVGDERLSETGRRYLVVHKDSIQAMRPVLDDEVDLLTASEILGLKKSRLRLALPRLFPKARKIEGNANRWAISRSSVEYLAHAGNGTAICKPANEQVSLDHVLRYWCCSDDEVTNILVCLKEGTLRPAGRLARGVGLSRLVLLEDEVRQLVETSRTQFQSELTIPQVAEALSVKQEVAYYLVRQGLLASFTAVIGRRSVSLVNRKELNAFLSRFAFARDLAKFRGTSSRSLQSSLATLSIYAVVSPTHDICRQVIYERTPELDVLFPELNNRHQKSK